MEKRRNETEQILRLQSAQLAGTYSFGNITVRDFKSILSVDSIWMQEHSLFVFLSPLTITDRWQGEVLPQQAIKIGDVAFLPADSQLSTVSSSISTDVTMVSLPDACFRAACTGEFDYDDIALRHAYLPAETCAGTVATTVRDLAAASRQNFPPMLIESMSLSLSVSLASAISSKVRSIVSRANKPLCHARKRRVKDYIESNIHKPISLTEIAGVAAMSPYHFSRSFKRSTGMSPVRYLWERRVAAAKAMIMAGGTSLTFVALSCGFSSQAHFTTKFRIITGQTPAAFMRAVRGNR